MLLDEIKRIKSTKRDLRNFGLTIGIVLLILSCLLYILKSEINLYLLTGGLIFIIFGLLIPPVLKPFQKVWMTLAIILNWFMTRIILSILFYFVLTPIGFARKIFGKKSLDLKYDKKQESYWNYREYKKFNKVDYEKQF